MFELTLSTTLDKQLYLSKLFAKLSCEIKRDAGLIAKQNLNGRAYLALAVDEDKKEYYKSKILDHILFMVLDDYKFNYYKELILPNEESELFYAFLKAITMFDYENDKEIVQSQIEFAGEFLIDSFFYFKLGLLRARWSKAVEALNQNKITLSEQLMIDVMKYLLAVSDNESICVNVSISPKRLSIKNYCQNRNFKHDFQGKSQFFAEIVKLNPTKINLKFSKQTQTSAGVKEKLEQIFGEKIYLLN